jgi:serine/threonine protein kinase
MSRKSRLFQSGFDTYTVVRQIGAGGSGVVFEVTGLDGNSFALKLLDNSKISRQKLKRFQNEIQFCLQPRSEHIIQVLDHGPTDDGAAFYVMPFYASTLRGLIEKHIQQDELLPLFGQILNSVEAAHLLGVCHRDIKHGPQPPSPVNSCPQIARRFSDDALICTPSYAKDTAQSLASTQFCGITSLLLFWCSMIWALGH